MSRSLILDTGQIIRSKIIIHGTVQGVGFRPFVYRLADDLGLKGWVQNSAQGVLIEIEGQREKIEAFINRLENEKPINAVIYNIEHLFLDPKNYTEFKILESIETGKKTTLILPDIATCKNCLNEVFDKKNRRYMYPFTNCTNCGPRFSIIKHIPYDRENTTMKTFKMCTKCTEEYNDPKNRRFHAEPNACKDCGPNIKLFYRNKNIISSCKKTLQDTMNEIKNGNIIAAKGIGGFHLICDARNNKAILKLRKRKNREEKPLALMFPSIEHIKEACIVSELEERLLLSSQCPIVLLKKKSDFSLPDSIAPKNPYLGVMLPYTPLHHILMRELETPIVATSGNISDEPVCTGDDEAFNRLSDIADLFLTHNRPIIRPVDDSVVRIICNREIILRRARGYAPLPILLEEETPNILALGGHLKNTISIALENKVFVSQHIGDLENNETYKVFQNTINSFKKLYDFTSQVTACDLHPDYLSTKHAFKESKNIVQVQHHHAHILSCMAENELDYPVLGIAWDGTGFGLDKTLWGSEFLLVKRNDFKRIAYFSHFRLPGGEKAIKEPRRIALGLLYDVFGDKLFEMDNLNTIKAFPKGETKLLKQMLKKNINCVLTSSIGRLFDAVSSILDLRQFTNFEGQAPMELEFIINDFETDDFYSFETINNKDNEPRIVIWSKMIREIIKDMELKVSLSEISAKYHNTLVEIIIDFAKKVNLKKIVLSGGCFQNKYLTERSVFRLQQEGFKPYWHQRIPPNDGGISLGQVIAAKETIRKN